MVHPSEKTTVLSLSVPGPLPHTGNARISYILGYRSKRLSQVNVIWTIDGTTTGNEIVIGIANSLRDHFSSEHFKPDSVVTNHQLAANTILMFRGSDNQKRTMVLLLSVVVASAQSEEKKGPETPPVDARIAVYRRCYAPRCFQGGQGPSSDPADRASITTIGFVGTK